MTPKRPNHEPRQRCPHWVAEPLDHYNQTVWYNEHALPLRQKRQEKNKRTMSMRLFRALSNAVSYVEYRTTVRQKHTQLD